MQADRLLIRPEKLEDLPEIREVNRLAFGRAEEAELVDRLRAEGDALISLVAEGKPGRLDGHILFSPLPITRPDGAVLTGAALAPVAVRPERQNQGIGGALVRAGIAACREVSVDVVVVLGHPAYYPRFGFSAERARNLEAPFSGPPFMALELRPGCLDGPRGKVRYARAFGLDEHKEAR
ncbi:MAG TPA: N-acetyltransferase [Alphaproteobacteria bacterium]|nr:N-acetyltransferase [Alphaproteobacteria bacterium]